MVLLSPNPRPRRIRYGFKFRQNDGTSSTRRGYASRPAARKAKQKLEESIRRGEVKVARESFAAFCAKLLAERKPYLTKGGYEDMETHRRLRFAAVLRTASALEDRRGPRPRVADQDGRAHREHRSEHANRA